MVSDIVSVLIALVNENKDLVIKLSLAGLVAFFFVYQIGCIYLSIFFNALDKIMARNFADKSILFAQYLRKPMDRLDGKIDGYTYGFIHDTSEKMLPSAGRSSGPALGVCGGMITLLLAVACFVINLALGMLSGGDASMLSRLLGLDVFRNIFANIGGIGAIDHMVYLAYFSIIVILIRRVYLLIAKLCWLGWDYPTGSGMIAPAIISFLEFYPIGMVLLRILMIPGKLFLKFSFAQYLEDALAADGFKQLIIRAAIMVLASMFLLYFTSCAVREYLPIVLLPLLVILITYFYPISFLKLPALIIGIVLYVYVSFRQLKLVYLDTE